MIGKLDIRGSGVTHVVLNINSNWLTYYDTQGVNDRKKYKELIYDLMKMFRGASVKKMVILTVPLVSFPESPHPCLLFSATILSTFGHEH